MKQAMELLAPAGSPEILHAVIGAGADAVYLGGDKFGARAFATNFSTEELLAALDYAHLRGKKIYLTVNTLLKEDELSQLYEYLLPFYKNGLDAVIVQDMGALVRIREWFPELEIHTSTQMTVTGVSGVRFLQQYGVTRVVLAREMSLAEMKKIHDETGMELEAFVHGALCYCYSGQCLFSSMLGGRSGNRGRCAQPCRLPYTFTGPDKKKKAEESYVLSLKDFNTIDSLYRMKTSGVFSLKIEGRMKQKSYAAGVVSMYRRYLDLALCAEKPEEFKVSKEDKETLFSYGCRAGFTDGYLHKQNGSDMITFQKPSFMQSKEDNIENVLYRDIDGQLTIKKGEPIQLAVWDFDHYAVAQAKAPDAAQKQPLVKADIIARINKTKDTAFLFHNLSVELDDGLFVPNGVINQLKREALSILNEQILSGYRREQVKSACEHDAPATEQHPIEPFGQQIVSTENRALLPVLLTRDWITHIYLDSSAYRKASLIEDLNADIKACHSAGKKAYYILPAICRDETMCFYEDQKAQLKAVEIDGFVVKNLESFWFVRENFPEVRLICDHNLYTYNDAATDAFLGAGASGVTVPLELNKREIAARDNGNSQMIIYGYYPLMTTAQCIVKNTGNCTKTPGISYLTDRYKKRFPVKNCCAECINIIYNSLPTMLFASKKELESFGITKFRLHFSIESEKEAAHILDLYETVLSEKKLGLTERERMNFTNGHYKRGVE